MWLIKLYPRAWRERYGDELAELLRQQAWSPGLVIDLIAGAIDARLNSQAAVVVSADSTTKKEQSMFAKVLHLRCAGHGPKLTARDQWLSAAVMLTSTLALTAVWVWAIWQARDTPYDEYAMSFIAVPYSAGLILAMPFTSLKGRSRRTQAIFMAGTLLALVAFCTLIGWIATRL